MTKPLAIKCNQCSHTSIIPQARHHTENSQGCYLCDAAPNKMTTELFLKRLNYRTNKFKNYDFSEFKYKGTQIKGIVTCSCKNTYKVNPNDLMTGYGCPECAKDKKTGRPPKKVSQRDIDYLFDRGILVNMDNYKKHHPI